MRTTTRMRASETCFGFPRLLSLIFEQLKVPLRAEQAIVIRAAEEVNASVLKSLGIPTDFGVSWVHDIGEASTSTQPPPHTQQEPTVQEIEAQHALPPPTPRPPPPSRSKWQEICCMEHIDQTE
mgnify:CR=1 FL=1